MVVIRWVLKTKFVSLLMGGAVAAAVAAAPIAAADLLSTTAAGPQGVHFIPADSGDGPGGVGCVNGQCGSGGVNGGPGGSGCIPTANGAACGSGGINAGPGGVPGGSGCLPGVGCGSGHG
jgi:hypothetical protein